MALRLTADFEVGRIARHLRADAADELIGHGVDEPLLRQQADVQRVHSMLGLVLADQLQEELRRCCRARCCCRCCGSLSLRLLPAQPAQLVQRPWLVPFLFCVRLIPWTLG